MRFISCNSLWDSKRNIDSSPIGTGTFEGKDHSGTLLLPFGNRVIELYEFKRNKGSHNKIALH